MKTSVLFTLFILLVLVVGIVFAVNPFVEKELVGEKPVEQDLVKAFKGSNDLLGLNGFEAISWCKKQRSC